MTIGASIILLALGAILSFAVNDRQIGAVDVEMIGYILMGTGVLGLLLGLIMGRRRRAVDETVIHEDRRV